MKKNNSCFVIFIQEQGYISHYYGIHVTVSMTIHACSAVELKFQRNRYISVTLQFSPLYFCEITFRACIKI